MRPGSYCGRVLLWAFFNLLALPVGARTLLVYVLNYGSARVDVVDFDRQKIVQVINGIPRPDGIAFSPKGDLVYISSNTDGTLHVIDRKSAKTVKVIDLTGKPNNIAITPDGKRLLICIRSAPGALDIVDTTTLQKIKTIPADGPLHNVFITPDGQLAVFGSEEKRFATALDLKTDQPVWKIDFDGAVRPMAFERGPDGSTKRMFVQIGEFRGFTIVDFPTHREVSRIELPLEPKGFEGDAIPHQATSHGIAVSPDGRSLWVASATNRCIFRYELPDLHLSGFVPTGVKPDWVTLSPDGTKVFVSNATEGSVSEIDAATQKEVARIRVGEDPRRIGMWMVP